MWRLRLRIAVTAVLCSVGAPVAAHGQGAEFFGIAAGVAPTNTGYDLPYNTGAHLSLFLEVPRAIRRLGLRAELFAGAFSRDTRNGNLSRRTSVPGASLSVVLPLGDATSTVQPYLLAGAGTYRTELSIGIRELHFGLAGGAGATFGRGRIRPFVEARVLRVVDGGTPRIIPIALGVRL